MARGSRRSYPAHRKAASDSPRQALADARRPDLSASPIPTETDGYDRLGPRGRTVFENLFRHDPARWTSADLIMIVRAAALAETLDRTETELAEVTDLTSAEARNLIKLQESLTRTQAALFRDLGIRARDGAEAVPSSRPVASALTAANGKGSAVFDLAKAV